MRRKTSKITLNEFISCILMSFFIVTVLGLAMAIALTGCCTGNPRYHDGSYIIHERWTGMTHPDMHY